jgi:AraC-like DNA-binding protein
VELAIFEHGSIVALYGGRQMTVPPGRLVVLWGAMPHRTLRLLGDTVGHGIRVPLQWVLRWKLPEAVVRRLLNFEAILAPVQEPPGSDLALVKQWVRFMDSRQPAGREIVLLEVQARLLRLTLELGAKTRGRVREPAVPPASDGFGLFERILRIISAHYQERLSIPEIARELRVSRVHVMRQFHKITGMSVLDYITQCRVSCAQRLLARADASKIHEKKRILPRRRGDLEREYKCCGYSASRSTGKHNSRNPSGSHSKRKRRRWHNLEVSSAMLFPSSRNRGVYFLHMYSCGKINATFVFSSLP